MQEMIGPLALMTVQYESHTH